MKVFSLSYLLLNQLILIIVFHTLIICQSLDVKHEKCIPKTNADEIQLNCDSEEHIAIHEAFFTASIKFRCPLKVTSFKAQEMTNEEYESAIAYPRIPPPCTDDLRPSMLRKCSGQSSCQFNITKDHSPGCTGEDGSVILKYTCVGHDKFQAFCNLNLTGNYGYVSNPGYPEYYPPFLDKCVWNITADEGQVILIDVLDVSIKEPLLKSFRKPSFSGGKTYNDYVCTDSLSLIEDNTIVWKMCGEEKSNLIQHRTKSNHITIELKSDQFSPTRGILFRYSFQNCPTFPAPKNGHLVRNGSFAYYTCCLDYVFEDTKEVERTLFCENGNRWNSSVAKCIAKDTLISSSLTYSNESDNVLSKAQTGSSSQNYISDIMIPVILMITLLLGNAVIIWVLFRLKRKQKHRQKNTESNIPLNPGSALQTSV